MNIIQASTFFAHFIYADDFTTIGKVH